MIEASIEPAARSWGVSRYSAEGGEFAGALAQARTVPMLAHRQVVIVTEAEALEKMPEGRRQAEMQDLADYFADPAPFTSLILEAKELDQRTKFAKMLLEQALVLSAELPEDPRERTRMAAMLAARMAGDRDSAIEADAACWQLEWRAIEIQQLKVTPRKNWRTCAIVIFELCKARSTNWRHMRVPAGPLDGQTWKR